MSTKKKRQHYVWRKYLRSWACNEKIWTFFKETNKVKKTGLMGVAQQKYFYKLVEINADDEQFIKSFIETTCHPSIRGLCLDFLGAFIVHFKSKKNLEQITDPRINKEHIAKEIEKIEVNLAEDIHSKFESYGSELLAVKGVQDLEQIRSGDNFYNAIIFICIQYFRTNAMKKTVLNSFRENKNHIEIIEKLWSVVSFSVALNVARNIALDPELRLTIYESQSEVKFLTGDQPVFNLKNDHKDKDGNVTELEFYYPLSPTHALFLHFEKDCVPNRHEVICVEKINSLNMKVIENSDFFVFSNNETQLNDLIS